MMHINSEKTALETLLHSFRFQMGSGYRLMALSLKHPDGTRQWIRGSLDNVFRGDIIADMEYHDLIVLEHYNDKITPSISCIDRDISLQTLVEMHSDQEICSMGTVAKDGPNAYFLFKNDPMSRYTLLGNEVISHSIPTGATSVSIMNNICGKLTCDRGVSHFIKL
jgi:hypothetical protein